MTTTSTVPVAGDRQVPWLKLLPKNWQFTPLKYLCRINIKSLSEDTPAEQTFKYIDIGSVGSWGEVAEVAEIIFGEAPSRARRILASGDVFISTVRTYLTAIAYANAKLDGCICSTGFAVLTPGAEVEPRFLYFWTRLAFFVSEIVARSTGVSYPAINATEIGQLPFPVLARSEQRAIAAFLDRKCVEVEEVVSKKCRLIELLRDERQALISRAVTQGLDATAPMKDSGTPWLGAVPKQWAVIRIKNVLHSLEQGWSPECESRITELDEWAIMKAGCVNRGVFDETEHKALPVHVLPIRSFEIRAGDLLVCRASGSPDLVGSAALVTRCRAKLLLCDKLFRLHCDHEKVSPRYLAAVLNSRLARYQIERDTRGAEGLANNITQSVIRELVFALPSLPEQNQITDYLDSEGQRISGLIAEMTHQLVKLREYRQTLISAAVTGKFTVPVEETPDFRAAVLAAEIIFSHPATEAIGRTKLHKTIFGAEHECDLVGIDSDYGRLAFGPYDDRLQKAVERELEDRLWYKSVEVKGQKGKKIDYVPLAQAGQHRAYFDKFYGDKAEAIARLVAQLRPLNKDKIERAITLYAAWNDFLIRSEPVDDGRLLTEVQSNWHPEKQHKEVSWRESLAWLKACRLIPHGFGKPTRPTDVLTGLTTAPEDDAGGADDTEAQ